MVGRRPILFGGLFVFATGPLLYFLAAFALVGAVLLVYTVIFILVRERKREV